MHLWLAAQYFASDETNYILNNNHFFKTKDNKENKQRQNISGENIRLSKQCKSY